MTDRIMTDYYAQRAAEYEQIYQKPERQINLKTLKAKIAGSFQDLDLLEIACGTGYWTQFAARSANSIVATDYNEEVIALARFFQLCYQQLSQLRSNMTIPINDHSCFPFHRKRLFWIFKYSLK